MSAKDTKQKYKFDEGERVLCFHGPLLYEAKALKRSVSKEKQVKYYIHYAGWNKNWDEWVPEDRMLKYNEANVKRQKEVSKQHSNPIKGKKGRQPKKSESSTETRDSTPSKDVSHSPMGTLTGVVASVPGGASTKRGRRSSKQSAPSVTPIGKGDIRDNGSKKENSGKEEEKDKGDTQKKKRGGSHVSDKSITTNTLVTLSPPSTTKASAENPSTTTSGIDLCVKDEAIFPSKIEVKIKIPDELKQYLTDDWDAVTRQHKVFEVPTKLAVQDIVNQYLTFKKAAKSGIQRKEVLQGIVEYFNVMLGSQLLYKFERPQYAEILKKHPETPLSQLYGSYHLLRLFVKLGALLGYSELDKNSMKMVLKHINDFLKFLSKKSAKYFSNSNFINVNPEYEGIAE